MHDVLIVGGGPAGLLTAALCAEGGLDVLVCEENDHIGVPTHCTGIVSLETADFAKIPDEIVLNHLTRATVVAPGGGLAVSKWSGDDREPVLVIDRGAFDRTLARRALEAGATVRTDARVTALTVEPDGVAAVVAGAAVRASVCVLACGVSYRFQRALGLGLPGVTVHTAQTEVDAVPGGDVEIHLGRAVAPGGFLWVVPVVRDGRARAKVGVMTARGDAVARLTTFLDRPAARKRFGRPAGPPLRRLLPLRAIPKTYGERLIVVGDAAGLTKPTTGGGVYYSLLTASLGAETVLEGFRAGRLDEAMLARYEERWEARLGRELRVAGWFRDLLTRCSDAEMDRVVAAFASEDVQALIGACASFNWHRGVIVELLRRPSIVSALLRAWFR